MKKNIVTWTTSRKTFQIKFTGLVEADGASVNDWRKISDAQREAINQVANKCELRKSHTGQSMTFNFSGSGEDDYGTYKLWRFPVFARNKDELIIFVKVWTGEIHGGSCVMWCNPYWFSDIASSAQFEVQANTALQHADAQAKKYTRLNLPK
jgi:hypothetical protein